ncbi:hypothetical protein [Allomesorhizobium alhagi]|uniref:Uncharacterized protein n=1 Tax=Mesorhizobium alhagi CCNWXJ12-2 TaxID=1107882 RepID=H0HYP1_9HYPH|nr:hypothetical protein [Mesorhizobium alhagi]EHK54161.1 hypothetical protein MAXJ12_26483 [Mesorhizobium alhagi CCNWXJ12-2]
MEALDATRRQNDLAEVFADAWGRGLAQRDAIQKALGLTHAKKREKVEETIRKALSEIGEEPDGFTLATKS